ncbi:MAG: hypothetical protein LKJ69_00565 [Lactobacillus sp.]|nr:hypothetical protein [Lactobacillus sp.]MCI2031873.1 hypothetical protein [Lactobacillus sp.]
MTTGKIGGLTGIVIAAAALQWGWSGLLLLGLAGLAGYASERWLWPQRQALWRWLRAGKQRLKKED